MIKNLVVVFSVLLTTTITVVIVMALREQYQRTSGKPDLYAYTLSSIGQ